MGVRNVWTAALDARIRALRDRGLSWLDVSTTMGMRQNTIIERGRKIGARKPKAPPAARVEHELKDRPPRPAGHRDTWPALSIGLSIAGLAYTPPSPVLTLATLTCQLIAGDPRGSSVAMCGQASAPGCAYCATHHALTHRATRKPGRVSV